MQLKIDTRFLETLAGYNTRRASVTIGALFQQRMAIYSLRPVDFSVLTLVAHNPGITSRQICTALDILPPNLVGLLKGLERRDLIEKREHPSDKRAQGLHLTPAGQALQVQAQETVRVFEAEAVADLTPAEQDLLNQLLRRVYRPDSGGGATR